MATAQERIRAWKRRLEQGLPRLPIRCTRFPLPWTRAAAVANVPCSAAVVLESVHAAEQEENVPCAAIVEQENATDICPPETAETLEKPPVVLKLSRAPQQKRRLSAIRSLSFAHDSEEETVEGEPDDDPSVLQDITAFMENDIGRFHSGRP